MRVISGIYKNRKLECPPGMRVRPTSDMVRSGIYNMLNNLMDYEGINVLDVCCGTGSCGIEAISRGAANATFIDNHPDSLKTVRLNLEKLGITNAEVLNLSAENLGRAKRVYDLVFVDPPYRIGLLDTAFKKLIDGGWINEHTMLVLEMNEKETLKAEAVLDVLKERFYSSTRVLIAKIKV